MSNEITRRRWLRILAAGVALPACDNLALDVLSVKVTPKSNGLTEEGVGIAPITSTPRFYVYQCCGRPVVDTDAWSCVVMANGVPVVQFSEWFLRSLEPVELEHTLQCIGGNPRNTLIGNALWRGLPFTEVLSALGFEIPAQSIQIRLLGADDYHTSIPVTDLDSPLWLVWDMNDEPLNADHGAPCRFLVPGRYGTKNVKWPVEVDFIDQEYVGFWESTGWSQEARYRQNGFILEPYDGAVLEGEVELLGTAFAGSDPIERVEISFDEGDTWEDTEIIYSPGADVWTLWRYLVSGQPGVYTAEIRVTTASGASSNGPDGTGQSDGYDGGMRIRFEVV